MSAPGTGMPGEAPSKSWLEEVHEAVEETALLRKRATFSGMAHCLAETATPNKAFREQAQAWSSDLPREYHLERVILPWSRPGSSPLRCGACTSGLPSSAVKRCSTFRRWPCSCLSAVAPVSRAHDVNYCADPHQRCDAL